MKIEKILAGIDFGPGAENVIGYSSFFAECMGASLTLLYVIDYLITPPAYLEQYIKLEKKTAEKKFAMWEKCLADAGIKIETDIIAGRLQESFDTAVEKMKADMIVLGFKSHTLRRSSSEKLIKGMKMPMLVVRGEKAKSASIGSIRIKRILCPTDFSEISMEALKMAEDLRDIFSAEIYILHVMPSYAIKKKIKKLKGKDVILKELHEDTMNNLNKLRSYYGIEKSEIDEGEPDRKIVSFSKERDIDLIVIGARGLGFIKGMLIGSVTDAVLKTSPCPVFVIH